MKTWDVLVVGEIYVDHVLSGFERWPQPGEEVVTEHYTREIGGGSATTACGLSRLGKSVSLVGVIGPQDAQWVRRRLDDFGVSSDGLLELPGVTGVTLSVSTREDRSFFTHVGVNRQLTARLLAPEILSSFQQARHVHFAMPLPRELATTLLPRLSAAGCTTSVDVGYQPAWLSALANHATCREVDYLLPNEKEAELLSGGSAPEAYFAFARRLGLRNAVLKLGARGVIAEINPTFAAGAQANPARPASATGPTPATLPTLAVPAATRIAVSPPAVAAVDTTGSGDAFDAGFIDGLLDGAPLEECLRRACICGALSTRVPGALAGLPGRHELWSTYEQTYGT